MSLVLDNTLNAAAWKLSGLVNIIQCFVDFMKMSTAVAPQMFYTLGPILCIFRVLCPRREMSKSNMLTTR